MVNDCVYVHDGSSLLYQKVSIILYPFIHSVESPSNQRWAFASTRQTPPSPGTSRLQAYKGLPFTLALQNQQENIEAVYRSASGNALQYLDGMQLTDLDVVNL